MSSLLILAFLSATVAVQYRFAYGEISRSVQAANDANLAQIQQRFGAGLAKMERYMTGLVRSERLLTLVRQLMDAERDTYAYVRTHAELRALLVASTAFHDSIAELDIVTPREANYISSATNAVSTRALMGHALYRRIDESDLPAYFAAGNDVYFAADLGASNEGYLYFVCRLDDEAYAVFCVDASWLDNLIRIDGGDTLLLREGQQEAIYASRALDDDESEAVRKRIGGGDSARIRRIHGADYSLSLRHVDGRPLSIISLQNVSTLLEPVYRMRGYMVVAVLTSLAFTAIAFRLLTLRRLRELRRITQSAEAYLRGGTGNLLPLTKKTRGLHGETALSFFGIVAVPLTVFTIVFSVLSAQVVEQSSTDIFERSMLDMGDGISAWLEDRRIESMNVMFDPAVQSYLRGDANAVDRAGLEAALGRHIDPRDFIALRLYGAARAPRFESFPSMTAGDGVPDEVWHSYGEAYIAADGEDTLYLTRKIKNVYDTTERGLSTIGYLRIDYSIDELYRAAARYLPDEGQVYLLDGADAAIGDAELPDALRDALPSARAGRGPVPVDGGRTFAYALPLRDTPFAAIVAAPAEGIHGRTATAFSINLNMLLVSLIPLGIASLLLARAVVKPIQELASDIMARESARGDGLVRDRFFYHEINEIAYALNRLNEETRRVYELEAERDRAELRALQAQINPHFLYNTFDSIKWMNRRADRERIDEMILSLSDLFRYGMRIGNNRAPLSEEIKHARAYVNIQKMRYAEQLDVSWDLSDEALAISVPRMILQPLVENAINHGVREIEDRAGHILVRASVRDGTLCICVSDDGPGIPMQRLEAMRADWQNARLESEHIGLYNVYRRLRLDFGDRFDMAIDSEPYVRTQVCICIRPEPGGPAT